MTKYEAHTPTVDELKEIFSLDNDGISAIDGLVYTALGLYQDVDYVNLARVIVDYGGAHDLAMAEARLQVIANHDERTPGYDGYLADSDIVHDRLLGVGAVLDDLSFEDREAFIDEQEAEARRLEGEQFAVDNGLTDLTEL